MLGTYLVAIVGVTGLLFVWIGVQALWRRSFPGVSVDGDVLAGRTRCQGCSCTGVCERAADGGEPAEREASRD